MLIHAPMYWLLHLVYRSTLRSRCIPSPIIGCCLTPVSKRAHAEQESDILETWPVSFIPHPVSYVCLALRRQGSQRRLNEEFSGRPAQNLILA